MFYHYRALLAILVILTHGGIALASNGPIIDECKIDPTKDIPPFGDFQIHDGPTLNSFSVGPAALVQVIRYDLAEEKAALNTGLGAGVALRFYSDTGFGGLKLKQVKRKCRGTTLDSAFGAQDPNQPKIAFPLFSIIPVLYVSKIESSDELNLQPAAQMGFLSDLLVLGAGFNLTGPNKGNVFLLFSLGYGFKF